MAVSPRSLSARLNDTASAEHGIVSSAAVAALALIEPRRLTPAQRWLYRGALAAVSAWTAWASLRTETSQPLSSRAQGAVAAGVGAATIAASRWAESLDAKIVDRVARAGIREPRLLLAGFNGAMAIGAWWLDRRLTARIESRTSLRALKVAAEDAPTPAAIVVSAVVMRNAEGEVLTVRKRGTSKYMFPGGKPEPGETAEQTALREAEEELGVTLDPEQLEHLGDFETAAANEPDRTVVAAVFEHPQVSGVAASGEIEELAWVAPKSTREDLAPLLREAVFPALRAR